MPKGSVQSGGKALRKERSSKPKMASPCKHPKVRIVSRTEDAEYVECVECGEVFDSDEFRDMEIEAQSVSEDSDADN